MGHLTKETLPEGIELIYGRESTTGKLLSRSRNGHLLAVFVYDKNGAVLKQSIFMGSNSSNPIETIFEYDDQARLIKSTDGLGQADLYLYNSLNQLVEVQMKNGLKRILKYDKLNRVIEEQFVDTTSGNEASRINTYRYDANGNVIEQGDAAGVQNIITYDAFNQVQTESKTGWGTLHYDYDIYGNLIRFTDGEGRSRIREFHASGKLKKEALEAGGELSLFEVEYYKNLFVKRKTDGKGNISDYFYNDASQLTRIDYFHASNAAVIEDSWEYSYDDVGRLINNSSTLGNISYQYEYDDKGKTTTEVNFGNFTKLIRKNYFLNGLKKSYINPENQSYQYQYDNLGRIKIVAISDLASVPVKSKGLINHTYNASGLNKTSLPGGAEIHSVINVYGEKVQTDYKNSAGSKLSALQFSYTPQGNISKIQSNLDQIELFYDEGARLVGLKQNNILKESYSYDRVGNRIDSLEYDDWLYNGFNQLVSYDDKEFSYDDNGNMISDGQKHYSYNASNRLTNVEQNGNTISNYRYDPLGRRISKTVNGVTTYFLYDDTGLLAEYDSQGGLITEYIYKQGAPFMSDLLMIKQSGKFYFSHNDQSMTSRALISFEGEKVWEMSGFGFESNGQSEHGVTNNLRFPGQYSDSEINSNYNYYRNYSPTLGRYIQLDPIGLKGDLNAYLYAQANPIRFIDALGLNASCSFYQTRCEQVGGIYYCSVAPVPCNYWPDELRPPGSNDDWVDCSRKCLQKKDVECDSGQCSNAGADVVCITKIHAECWMECY